MTALCENNTILFADRVRGALWGSLVGDAFCLGSHWIYNLDELTRRFPGGVRGFEEPGDGHYHYGKKAGDLTHYGDAALLLLASMTRCGRFDVIDFGSAFIRLLEDEHYSGYRDHATKGMLSNYRFHRQTNPEVPFDFQQGADDDQSATVTRLAPLVAVHGRDAHFLEIVATLTRVSQNNPLAIAFSRATALILEEILAGLTPLDAVAAVRGGEKPSDGEWHTVDRKMKLACAASNKLSAHDATLLFGQACPLESSFTAALHTTLNQCDDFAAAIRVTANAGGDSAGRAAMIGAWLGAYHGIQGIPDNWCTRLSAYEQIASDIERIIVHHCSSI